MDDRALPHGLDPKLSVPAPLDARESERKKFQRF
jgi:hypothetical protein